MFVNVVVFCALSGSKQSCMPLIFQKQISEATKIGVWHITEAEDFFSSRVNLQREISHPHKRLQHLAGRTLLLSLFPDFPVQLIQIADTRKPFLEDEDYHFSISHCGDYAAALVSTENRVGVDIEIPQQKIESLAYKFLSQDEHGILRRLNKADREMFTLAWSAKEAMFKWYGSGNVDFKEDMQIIAVQESAEGFNTLCRFKKDIDQQLSISSVFIEGNFLSFVMT